MNAMEKSENLCPAEWRSHSFASKGRQPADFPGVALNVRSYTWLELFNIKIFVVNEWVRDVPLRTVARC